MKKTLLAFAAMAFAVSFTACGGKTEAGAEAADSAQDSAVAEAEPPTSEFENDLFTLTAPEGWEVSKSGSDGVRMEDVKSTETFKPVIKVRVYTDKTLQDKSDYLLNQTNGYKKGADLTIGSYTFTTFRNEQSELYSCYAEVEGGKLLEVETVYFEPESEVLKPVVESLKLK